MRRPTEHQLRRDLGEISRTIWEKGWVANHDGNVTARIGEARFLATPTALSKRVIRADMMLVLDGEGKVLRGKLRPFSELNLHQAVYRARPDAQVVLHAHPPFATTRAVLNRPLPCFLPEAVVSMGAEVPVVPFAAPGKDAVTALEPYLQNFDAVLLAQHGALTWGVDAEQAFLRMELMEHLASIALKVEETGVLPELPSELVTQLLAKRAKAGLGPDGRKG